MKTLNKRQNNNNGLTKYSHCRNKVSALLSIGAVAVLAPSFSFALDLQTSQNTGTIYFGHSQIIDDQITITHNTDVPGVKIFIKNPQVGDVLGFIDQNGITGSFNNLDSNLFVLTLTGVASAPDYQSALRSVTLNSSQIQGDREIVFAIDANDSSILFNNQNHHYYKLTDTNPNNQNDAISWEDANIGANAQSYLGLQGYLVTITDSFENNLVTSDVDDLIWAGGSNKLSLTGQSDSSWYWVSGPEADTLFWDNSVAPATAPSNTYTNWNTNEPNNHNGNNEYYLHFYGQNEGSKSSKWNDLNQAVAGHVVTGYMVEFGGMPSDTTSLVATKMVNVSENNAPEIAVTLGSNVVENSATLDQVIATYNATDAQDPSAIVTFANSSNANGYYRLFEDQVLLTQAGADFANAGNALPAFTLLATDSLGLTETSASQNVVTQFANDLPTVALILSASVNEQAVVLNQEIATFVSNDEEDSTPVISFAPNTNTNAHYSILNNTVVLTQAGVNYVKAGNALSAITLTATDSSNASVDSNSVTPTTILVNDAPSISVALSADIEEQNASEGQVIATFIASDEESTPTTEFAGSTNANGYLALSGNNIVLTQSGAQFVKSGGSLTEFGLTTTDSDSSNTVSNLVTPNIQSFNDLPVIDVVLGSDINEETVMENQVVASFSTTDEEDTTASVDFASGSNLLGHYQIDGLNITLTQAGADYVSAGNTLEAFTLTAIDSDNAEVNSSPVSPNTVLENDAPMISATLGSDINEATVMIDQVVASFTATDEEDATASVDFASGSNLLGYYQIDGQNITLTQAGADYVSAGNTLEAFTLTATDSDLSETLSAAVTPNTVMQNDAPMINVILGESVTESSVVIDQVIASFTATDEEEHLQITVMMKGIMQFQAQMLS